MAITTNNSEQVVKLLNPDPVTGNHANANFKLNFMNFIENPLLLAI